MKMVFTSLRKPRVWASVVSGATEQMYGYRPIDMPGMYWVGYTYKYKMIRTLARSSRYSRDAVAATLFSFQINCDTDDEWKWVCMLTHAKPDTLFLVLLKERRILDELKIIG
jgi:hypothetical protein